MAQVEDFYDFLEVRDDASAADIEAVIQAQRKIWIKRQNSADAAKQIEAQTRVTMLDRAAKTLLKDSARSDYDKELALARAASARQPAYTETRGGGEAPPPPNTGPTGAELVQRAFEFYHDGAGPNVVLQTLDQAKRLVRPTSNVWLLRGFMQEQLKQTTQAEISYREALALDPENVQALINLSIMESHRGQHDRARERAMEATRLAPEDLNAQANLGWAFLNADQPEEALRYLKPVAEAHPEAKELQQILARAIYRDTLAHMTLSGESRFFTSQAQVKYAKEHLPAALLAAAGNTDLEETIGRTLMAARKAARPKVVNFRRHWWKLLLIYIIVSVVADGFVVLVVMCAIFAALCVRTNTRLTTKELANSRYGSSVKWGIK